MKAFKASQYLKHGLYGYGVVTESDTERTTIDFENHGKKKFVTSMIRVELVDGNPPKPARGSRRKKAAKAETAQAVA